LTRLRENRTNLHRRLNEMAYVVATAANGEPTTPLTSGEVVDLLREAAKAMLTCPVDGCAYCYTVEREDQP
jgi:hypothetical protein